MVSALRDDPADRSTDDYLPANPRAPRVRVEVGGLSHPGKVRDNNEDQFLVAKLAKSMRVCLSSLPDAGATHFSDEEGYLFVVADGMGGAAAGEQASALAVQTVEGFVLDTVKWFLHLGGQEQATLASELRGALERADRTVIERARADARLAGMGTTLTLAYSVGRDLFVVHAGDSRAYLLRDGQITQLTTDHTLAQIMVEGGALSAEAARRHRARNVVTNVVGGPNPGVRAEIHKLLLEDRDTLLLCSDGLSGPVPDDRITAALQQPGDPDATCRQLVDLALEAGAPDNVTVVLARYAIA